MSSIADTGSHRVVNQPSRRRGAASESRCERCGAHCLSCRRALATEDADAAAPKTATREERAKIRTQALIEFEIDRDPDRPNGEIAKVVRCSVPAVLKARKRLEAEAEAK